VVGLLRASLLVGFLEFGDVDAISLELGHQFVDGGLRQRGVPGEDPGELDVGNSQDGLARVDEREVVIISVDHVVLAIGRTGGEADLAGSGLIGIGAVGVTDGANLSAVLEAAVVDLDVAVVLQRVLGARALALLEVRGEHVDLVPVAQVLGEVEVVLGGHGRTAPEAGALSQGGVHAQGQGDHSKHLGRWSSLFGD